MATDAREPQVEHIGRAPHATRNLIAATAVLLLGGVMVMFYWFQGQSEAGATAELDHFRQAMHQHCKDPQFAGPPDRRLVDAYSSNAKMREVAVAQFHELERGSSTCDEVMQRLRTVDFPVSSKKN